MPLKALQNMSFLELLKKFIINKKGNIALTFALGISGLMIALTSGIEFSKIISTKARLQEIADSVVLATKREQINDVMSGVSESESQGETVGRKYFESYKAELPQDVINPSVSFSWASDSSVAATVSAQLKPSFAGILQFQYFNIAATGVADAGLGKKLEVAILLDNTSSMFQTDGRPSTRFTLMREAAKQYVNSLFTNITQQDRLRIAVIPWTTTVNINGEVAKAWDNSAVTTTVQPDYGSRTLPTNVIDRKSYINQNNGTLNNLFAPTSWRGCISGNGESTTDYSDAPKSGMTWDALQVPPTNQMNTLQSGTWQYGSQIIGWGPDCNSQTQGYNNKSPKSLQFGDFTGSKTRKAYNCQAIYGNTWGYFCNASSTSRTLLACNPWNFNGRRNTFFNYNGVQPCHYYNDAVLNCFSPSDYNTNGTNYGNRSNARGCVSDPNEIAYNNAGNTTCQYPTLPDWTSQQPIAGPNINCPMPMLGLSGSRKQILDTIDRMSPAPGGTHADVGLRWGLRVLSPRNEWATFFQHTTPQAFKSDEVQKIMILLTDGSNEQALDFPGYWGCRQVDNWNPGCNTTDGPDRTELDNRMLNWCKSIRENYGVAIFTVAVNVSDTTATNLLQQCAGSPDRAYKVDAADLSATFAEISRESFMLRLIK